MSAAWTGIAALAAALASFALAGDVPDDGATGAAIVAHFAAGRTAHLAGVVMCGLAATLMVAFGAHLRHVLRAADRTSLLPDVVLAGTIVLAVGLTIDGTFALTLIERADDLSPDAAQAVGALYTHDFLVFATGLQIMLLGLGLAIVRTEVLPTPYGIVALLLFATFLTPVGFVGFGGGALLLGVLSVVLARRPRLAVVPDLSSPAAA